MILKNKTKCSVIIATYNSEKYIIDCMNAIKSQTFQDYEVIIVDGGSSDNTLSLLKAYKDKISHIISEKDRGIYDAWNKGLRLAKGEWVTFVGSDDIMHKQWLESLFLVVKSDVSINFVSGKVKIVKSDLSFVRYWGTPFEWGKFKNYMNIAHVGALHKKCLFDKYGYFDTSYKIVADYEFLLRVGENLNAGFANFNIGLMRGGGASDSIEAIKETYKAHLENHTLAPLKAFYNYLYGVAAFYKRKIIY